MNKNTININGLNLSYYKEGEGKNLIFLHGWGQNIESFGPILELLKEDYCVWALDLPGFGQSQEPEVGMTIYEYEEIVSKFIEEQNIVNPTLVGHSFGGRISIIYASKNINIDKVILTGAAGIKPKRTMTYHAKVAHYKFMKFLTLTPLYRQYRDDLLNSSGSSDYKSASQVMKDTLIKVVNEDLQYLMGDIAVPAYLYWGENDDATPVEDGIKMNNLIENSELKIMPNSTHYAYLENYPDFVSEIVKFLENNK